MKSRNIVFLLPSSTLDLIIDQPSEPILEFVRIVNQRRIPMRIQTDPLGSPVVTVSFQQNAGVKLDFLLKHNISTTDRHKTLHNKWQV